MPGSVEESVGGVGREEEEEDGGGEGEDDQETSQAWAAVVVEGGKPWCEGRWSCHCLHHV